jgi:hypothetical protein
MNQQTLALMCLVARTLHPLRCKYENLTAEGFDLLVYAAIESELVLSTYLHFKDHENMERSLELIQHILKRIPSEIRTAYVERYT